VTADVKAGNHDRNRSSGGVYWSEKKLKTGYVRGLDNETLLRFTASHAIPTIFWRVCRGLSRPWKTQSFVKVEAS
jgi:hypothetical protein